MAKIRVNLDILLCEKNMTLKELSDKVGITYVNLSKLKNGRARALRFTTLLLICQAMDCEPGDLLMIER